jgi:hypothetical protein
MRALVCLLIAACSGGHPASDADAGFIDRLDFRGSCAYALAPDGALVFPDTAAQVQTSYRAIDAVNVGERAIPGYELLRWQLEGADAADFTVEYRRFSRDGEACTNHTMGADLELPVGSFCRLDITFHPTTLGVKQATVHVTHLEASIDQTFALRGAAVAAPAGLYASTPDLYLRPPSMLDSQGLSLVNGGTTDVALGDPVLTSGFAIYSGPPAGCPAVLTPGGSCYVGVIGRGTTSAGCPMGMFTTTTSAIVVPLTARYVSSTVGRTATPGLSSPQPP